MAVNTNVNTFPFSAPFTNAGSAGTLSSPQLAGASISEREVQGFIAGAQTATSNVLSFPFTAAFTSSTNVGDMSVSRGFVAGQSSTTDGYASGGRNPPTTALNVIDRFPFSSPFGTATDIGNLSFTRTSAAGVQSSTDGFTAGGQQSIPPGGALNRVDRFPFSSPFTTATDVGDLNTSVYVASGQFSPTDGHVSGGVRQPFPNPIVYHNRVQKFPFAAPFASASNFGTLRRFFVDNAGNSSNTDGYVSGGASSIATNIANSFNQDIDRYPFSAPFGSSTDIGNLTSIVSRPTGHQ